MYYGSESGYANLGMDQKEFVDIKFYKDIGPLSR
jgi:hypothetical protein